MLVNLTDGTGDWSEAQGDTLALIEEVRGSSFNDLLIGSAAADWLYGNAGADSLVAATAMTGWRVALGRTS